MIEAQAQTVALDSGAVCRGLRELNPDLSFDAVVNRPSDNAYVLKGGDHMEETRGGVYYQGRFMCAMDRGVIAEQAVWEMQDGYQEIRMAEIERYDDTRVLYVQVLPTDQNYHVALTKAQAKDDNFTVDDDGKPVFTPEDVDALQDKAFGIIDRIAEAVLKLNGLHRDSAEAASGN